MKQTGLTSSTSDAIRMIKQSAVKVNNEKIDDPALVLVLDESYIVQVGKRRIAKVHLKRPL